jgi:peptide/nickel transport system substrate-binding protein
MSKISRLVVITAVLATVGSLFAPAGVAANASTSLAAATSGAGQQGGAVTFLAAGDVDSLDPGITHSDFGYMVQYAVNRTLYSFKPGGSVHPVPDLATGAPIISNDGKTITVHIRKGIYYSPPEPKLLVTSSDIKYAFERAFSTHVPNSYAEAYFGTIVGAPSTPSSTIPQIPGIVTPDKTTIMFKLSLPDAAEVAEALVLPITVPVPESYASQYDQSTPSAYGEHLLSVGPYMVKSYTAGSQIELVRNPSWARSSDYRPAYLDSVTIKEGNSNVAVASGSALKGSSIICCDTGQLPPAVLHQASLDRQQFVFTPSHATRWIALNTNVAPFTNIYVRQAVIAVLDRNNLLIAQGGRAAGEIANGWIPPGTPEFKAAGGLKQNNDLDFMKYPQGNLELAKQYMLKAKAAGVANISSSGLYTGPQVVAVAPNVQPELASDSIAESDLAKLGFRLTLHEVTESSLYTGYCGEPSTMHTDNIGVCMDVVTLQDYADPQGLLLPAFDGKYILAQGNLNWSGLNDSAVNAAVTKAAAAVGKTRLKDWVNVNNLVASQAPGAPYLWYKTVTVASKNVKLVTNGYYATADLNFTSIR